MWHCGKINNKIFEKEEKSFEKNFDNMFCNYNDVIDGLRN